MAEKIWDSVLSLLQQLDLGWSTGWWFTAAFGLMNFIIIIKYGRIFTKRLLAFPKFRSLMERIISMTSIFLFARALMVYTVFVPIKVGGVLFYVGITVFVLGLIAHTNAMISFAITKPDKPVLKGVYQYTRHPMQLVSIVMWIGVGIATASCVILVACGVQLFLSRPFLIAQERYCLDTYGKAYREYMRRTPRYLVARSL